MESQDNPGGAADRTPNADMQAEDTGTERSSGEDVGARGNAASAAMKQEHKTESESGSQGETRDER